MCSSKPKMPAQSEQEKPAVLLTARDGMGASQGAPSAVGRKKFRIDLNSPNAGAYGSSLVIPN